MTELQKTIKFFHESAGRDLNTAEYLFKGKRYDGCLFFCHLALEKLLKGILTEQTDAVPPYTHDLNKLAHLIGADLSREEFAELDVITSFNISGRYEDEKHQFYKKCTREFALKYFDRAKELFLWLRKNFPKK